MSRSSFPRADDHLVVPEITRDEMIRGRRVVALPALPPRARKKIDLDYVVPLAVASLLDPHLADAAVLDALIAKGNPVILKWKAEAEARGKAERVAESILGVLEARAVAVSAAQREEILGCSDRDRLDRWLRRAALASSVDEVTAEP